MHTLKEAKGSPMQQEQQVHSSGPIRSLTPGMGKLIPGTLVPLTSMLKALFLLGLAAFSGTAGATELINDGWSDGQAAFFQQGFVSGEIGASRFVPAGPCPCYLTHVSLLYGGDTATRTIRVYVWEDGSGLFSPGPEIYAGDFELTGADDALQLIDLSAAGIFVNGPFRVGIGFFDADVPSIARDGDLSIQPNTNFILADGLGWFPSDLLGLTGDWIIRAHVEEQGDLADEIKNDSWPPSLVAHFQAGFAAGESAAVRLIPPGPCPCSVDLASVLIGGAPGFADIGLRIWDDAALTDNPGSVLFSQDYELEAAGATLNLIPLTLEEITVTGPFRLGFEMLDGGLPALARDDDGITAGVNFIDDESDGWVESGSKGLMGDWIMRAAVTAQDAVTTVLGYDNWNDLGLPAFQGGFEAGEIAAARLTPAIPCPCRITGLRFMFGGASGPVPVTLRIWEDVGVVNPGTEVWSAPMMLEGNDVALTNIDLAAESIVVSGPFRVGIEFGQAGPPAIARDHDGLQAGLNFIYLDSASWVDAGDESVPGDWIIRATVVPEIVMMSGFE
jgi:hypothetical protein